MKVDPQTLLDDGFIILRKLIPAGDLDPLRACFEELVERQKAIWARDRGPDDPPGGQWETGAQPRLSGFESLIDENTAAAVEFCLGDSTRGVCEQIMNAPAATPHRLMNMCNPVQDHGPAAWHRDIHPIDQAPLCGLSRDLLTNQPGYLQWNIALHDDDVLWVVPGSHRRGNTDAENDQLRRDVRAPLPGGVQVELRAGDGVVYTNTILHWGSNYSARRRRTVHLGYRAFGGAQLPYVTGIHRDRNATQYLSPSYQKLCAEHEALYTAECDVIESVYRALIERDEVAFGEGVATLHPGEEQRIVAVVLLSKLAYKMCRGAHPERNGYGGDFSQEIELGPRFTAEEKEELWIRWAPLDEKLKAGSEQYIPGYQSGPMQYYFEDMPSDLTIDDFVATWSTHG